MTDYDGELDFHQRARVEALKIAAPLLATTNGSLFGSGGKPGKTKNLILVAEYILNGMPPEHEELTDEGRAALAALFERVVNPPFVLHRVDTETTADPTDLTDPDTDVSDFDTTTVALPDGTDTPGDIPIEEMGEDGEFHPVDEPVQPILYDASEPERTARVETTVPLEPIPWTEDNEARGMTRPDVSTFDGASPDDGDLR